MMLAAASLMVVTDAAAQSGAALRGNPGAFFGPDDYPPEAIRVGAQGRVVVELAIDSTGAVGACSVKTSSGNAALDKGTCDIALQRVQFSPAKDRKGRPISATYTLPVRWVLPRGPIDAGQLPAHMDVATETYVSAEGIIASCTVLDRKGLPDTADPCSIAKPGNEEQVLEKDGRPVSYKIVRRMVQDVTLGDLARSAFRRSMGRRHAVVASGQRFVAALTLR